MLVQLHRRITVRRLQDELNLPRSTIYRWLQAISSEIAICLEDGVVRINGAENFDHD